MASIPKAPPSTQISVPTGPTLSPQDIARCIDLLQNFCNYMSDMMHRDDLAELKVVAGRIRVSSNL